MKVPGASESASAAPGLAGPEPGAPEGAWRGHENRVRCAPFSAPSWALYCGAIATETTLADQ